MDNTRGLNRVHGGKVFETARRLNVAPEEILDFSASINPLGPPPGLKAYLFDRFDRLVHYPEMGAETLARALEERWSLPEGSVLVGNGSTTFIYLLPRVLKGGSIRIAGPAFGEYENAALLAGRSVEYVVPGEGPPWVYGPDALDRLWEREGGIVWIANPANPTGQLVPRDWLLERIRRWEDSGTTIVLDEAFIDFHPGDSLVADAPRHRNLIVLRSLTKMFALPGLRVGWMAAHPDRIREVAPRMEPWGVNLFAQEAGLYCLNQTAYRQRSLDLIERERAWLLDRLRTFPALTPFPSAANYLIVRLEDPEWNAPRLAEATASQKILIRDCSSFRHVGDRFVRIAVRSRAENQRLVDCLRNLFV